MEIDDCLFCSRLCPVRDQLCPTNQGLSENRQKGGEGRLDHPPTFGLTDRRTGVVGVIRGYFEIFGDEKKISSFHAYFCKKIG